MLANFQKISKWNPPLPLNVNLQVYYRPKREITKVSSVIKKSLSFENSPDICTLLQPHSFMENLVWQSDIHDETVYVV